MKRTERLTVTYHGRTVGTLTMTPDHTRCAFAYDKEWLSTGFSIAPLELPLKSDLFIAKPEPFGGNFGIFEDSLPDGYGTYLLDRMLRREGLDIATLTPVERLSIVGSSGMGALCYVPETKVGEQGEAYSLDTLQQMALDVLSEKEGEDPSVLYFNSGNSGGCRPKCLVTDDEGHWLVKFRHTYDPKDMGIEELRYNECAHRAGITVPDFKLMEGKYFATRRFDLRDGQRLHVATAAALLGVDIRTPNVDYKTLLHLTGFITQDPTQVDEMYRRMAFNILTDNKDDHAKNFAFLYDEGHWSLAPAYDLTRCTAGYNGEHATTTNGHGRPTLNDMLTVGETIRIPRKRGLEIIRSVTEACREILAEGWKDVRLKEIS